MVGLAYLTVTGLLLQGFVNVMNSAYSLRDTTTAEGVHQPTTRSAIWNGSNDRSMTGDPMLARQTSTGLP